MEVETRQPELYRGVRGVDKHPHVPGLARKGPATLDLEGRWTAWETEMVPRNMEGLPELPVAFSCQGALLGRDWVLMVPGALIMVHALKERAGLHSRCTDYSVVHDHMMSTDNILPISEVNSRDYCHYKP